jgi:signal transduction histidine kinase
MAFMGAATSRRRGGSAAAVLDFAVGQILRDDTALGALPAVLAAMVEAFGLRAALAFQPSGGQDPAVLALHPRGAVDQALLARIGVVTAGEATESPLVVTLDGQPGSVLLARSVPVDGQSLCALALIAEVTDWEAEVRSTAHAVAGIVATQIRHANDVTALAERQTLTRDLTEIERSHAELADQTERLNCLIASAIPGVLITDERGTVTNVSQSFGTMFGLDEPLAGTQLVGTQGAAVLRRVAREFADPVRFTRRAVAVLRARQPMTGEQLTCADGRTVEWDYWPVLVDGRHRGEIWLAWDMSDRKALERQRIEAQRRLAEQNARLRQLDEARNQFLAIVSHELRTPLTSIVSFSELIKGEADGLTPEGVKFLDIIERNADRLHRLVGDLLMLDRLEAGALPLDLAPVSVADVAAEAVRSAAPAAAKQGIAIEVSTGEGPIVAADHRRLMQVLDNLIANAVKFSHRNQRVLVTARYHGDQWRIDVTDAGIGIPPEEAGQLFNRFVRASNARTAGLPGTGLGLSIVKVLTEMHGGHVEVASTLGRGSTFSVYLPETGNGS